MFREGGETVFCLRAYLEALKGEVMSNNAGFYVSLFPSRSGVVQRFIFPVQHKSLRDLHMSTKTFPTHKRVVTLDCQTRRPEKHSSIHGEIETPSKWAVLALKPCRETRTHVRT